jgi:hypothetical protein
MGGCRGVVQSRARPGKEKLCLLNLIKYIILYQLKYNKQVHDEGIDKDKKEGSTKICLRHVLSLHRIKKVVKWQVPKRY